MANIKLSLTVVRRHFDLRMACRSVTLHHWCHSPSQKQIGSDWHLSTNFLSNLSPGSHKELSALNVYI